MAQQMSHAAWAADDFEDFDDGLERSQGRGSGTEDFGFLHPDERIGRAPRSRVRSALGSILLLAVSAGGGWGLWKTHDTWRPWVAAGVERMTAEIERRRAASAAAPAPVLANAIAAPPPVQPLATKEVQVLPETPSVAPVVTTPAAAAPPIDEGATGATTEAQANVPPAPLPEPEADPKDPYQKRALKAGLHPDLSRVLLSSMSDTDYRNAGEAVRKALAEASDDDKFIWPQKRTAKLATFQIHFVTGSSVDCRRYIVTVVKNGWTTTARPMEKCGIETPKRTALRQAAKAKDP